MKTYKFKLYHSKKNKKLYQQINISGIIYNHCIALHKRYYKMKGKSLNRFELSNHITKLKKLEKYKYWNLVGSQAVQNIAERIDNAYKLFFRNCKLGIDSSPPGFKKVKKYSSFTLKQAGWKLLGENKITIQKRNYKFSKSREIPENIKTVTIKRDKLGHLYLYFVVDEETIQENQSMTGEIAGFDFGLKTFLTSSEGEIIKSPLYYKQAMGELKIAQRELSSKKKGSNNRKKAILSVCRIHKKVANKRRDWFFKLSHDLTDRYDYLIFEDLCLKGMRKLWGRKMDDLALSEFFTILNYVSENKRKIVFKIDRFYPSSKECSNCGHIFKELKLSDRTWKCLKCKTIHDRDFNASTNIKREGASSLRLGNLRPTPLAISA